MNATWASVRLDHVATVKARIGWKALTASEYQDQGYAFLSTPNIKSERIDLENVNYISEFRYRESPELQLQVGDVLLAKDGSTLGVVNVVRQLPRAATVNGSIAVIRSSRVDSRFLMYVLRGSLVQSWIQQVKDGMGVPHLFQADIRKLSFLCPESIDQQRRIADFLDDQVARIDNIVAARERQRNALANLRKQMLPDLLLASGAEVVLGRTPSKMRGSCPPGWRVGELGHLLNQLTNGYVGPTRDILEDSGVPYIQSLHIKDGQIDFDRRPYYVSEQWHLDRPRIALRQDDILIVQTGDIGQVALVSPGFGAASCHALLIARPRLECISPKYLAGYLRSTLGYQELLARATGALHPHLESGIKSTPIVVPPLKVQNLLVEELRQREHEVGLAVARFEVLDSAFRELKRSLITAAVTGEFDVSSADGSRVPV